MKIDADPSKDNLFKLLLHDRKIAISLIESFIHVKVNLLDIIPVEAKTNYRGAKRIVFDYACVVNEQIVVVIEMQRNYLSESELIHRMAYYHMRSGAQLLVQGDDYENASELYTIVLSLHSPFHMEEYDLELNFQNCKYGICYPKTHLLFYDLERAYQLVYGKEINELNSMEVWMMFFMHVFKKMPKTYVDELMERSELKMAAEVMRRTSKDLLNAVVKSLEGMPDDDVMYMERLKQKLKAKDKSLEEKDKRLKEKDKSLEEKDKSLEEKDKSLEEKDKSLEEKDKLLVEKDEIITSLRKELLARRLSCEL